MCGGYEEMMQAERAEAERHRKEKEALRTEIKRLESLLAMKKKQKKKKKREEV